MRSDSTIPAVAKATALAARNRRRSGAASSELVIVRWRHSPLIPTTASKRMKKLLVSDANTSTRTESSVGSVSSATSVAISTDVPAATMAMTLNVRVVRSLSSSARSSAVIGNSL